EFGCPPRRAACRGIEIGECEFTAGGEHGIGLGQGMAGTGQGGDILAPGDRDGDRSNAAIAGGDVEVFSDDLPAVELVLGARGVVRPDAGRVDGEGAVVAGGCGLGDYRGCGGIEIGEDKGTAGGEHGIRLGQAMAGTGQGGDVVGAGDRDGDGSGAAVRGGNVEGFGDDLTGVELVLGAGGSVGPGAGRIDRERAVGADVGGLRHDGGCRGVEIGECELTAGGEHGIDLGQGMAGTGQGGDILAPGDRDGDRSNAAIAGGDVEVFSDDLPAVELVLGTRGVVRPDAGRVDVEGAVVAGGCGLGDYRGCGGVEIGEDKGTAGGEHGIRLGQGMAGTGQGGDVVGAGDRDGDGSGAAVGGGNVEGFGDDLTGVELVLGAG